MNTLPITVRLTVRVSERIATATVRFRNESKENQYLYKPNLCVDGTLANNVFVISKEGQRIRYTGKYVKRPAPRATDYLVLDPAAEHVTECVLNTTYDMGDETGTFTVRYEAIHGSPNQPITLLDLVSNDATFTID